MANRAKEGKAKKYSFLGMEIGRIGWLGSLLAFVTIPTVLLPYMVWFMSVNRSSISKDPERWAQFGDYLAGTAGPLLGFASIMLLVATLHLQMTELKEQREELKRSTDETAKQNRILVIQSFEQSFFSWLNSYRSLVNASVHTVPSNLGGPDETTFTGKEAIGFLVNKTVSKYNYARNSLDVYDIIRDIEPDAASENQLELVYNAMMARWQKTYESEAEWLGEVFRTLYGLVRWIDRHETLMPAEKQHYMSIIKAQLSNSEARALTLNAMTEAGSKFLPLMKRYRIPGRLPVHSASAFEFVRHHPKWHRADESQLAG